jgi:hypothetical protein
MTRKNKTEKPNEAPDDEWDEFSVPFCPCPQSCRFCGGKRGDPLDEMSEAEWEEIEAEMIAEVDAALASLSPISDEPDDIPF